MGSRRDSLASLDQTAVDQYSLLSESTIPVQRRLHHQLLQPLQPQLLLLQLQLLLLKPLQHQRLKLLLLHLRRQRPSAALAQCVAIVALDVPQEQLAMTGVTFSMGTAVARSPTSVSSSQPRPDWECPWCARENS